MDRRLHALFAGLMVALLALVPSLSARPAEPPAPEVLFRDVRVFDGKSASLSGRTSVLVRGNAIAAIGADAVPTGTAVTVIDGGGRTLMPGLIDAHVHIMFATISQLAVLTGDIGSVNVAAAIADDPDTVRRRARGQLALGASQVKLMAGGGVSSSYDPLDVTQYTVPELRAAVEAAENWGTYVTVHAYTPRAVRQAIEAGVRCIDHGQLLDEATARLMAEKGVWWSPQPFLDDRPSPFPEGSANRRKQLEMLKGTDTAYALAKKHRIRTAWGTDTLFDAEVAATQGAQLAKMARWYTPAEVLRMATADNAELLALSGLRSPYAGRLGVVEEGALADLLLVDGDPIADVDLVADPAKNFVVIMKDGRICKNTTRAP